MFGSTEFDFEPAKAIAKKAGLYLALASVYTVAGLLTIVIIPTTLAKERNNLFINNLRHKLGLQVDDNDGCCYEAEGVEIQEESKESVAVSLEDISEVPHKELKSDEELKIDGSQDKEQESVESGITVDSDSGDQDTHEDARSTLAETIHNELMKDSLRS